MYPAGHKAWPGLYCTAENKRWLKKFMGCDQGFSPYAQASLFSMLFTCLAGSCSGTFKPLAVADRGGSIPGSGGGKGGSGGGNENSSNGNEDEPPFGDVGWGSLMVGCFLGGSLCLNLVLLGLGPKSQQATEPLLPTVDEEVQRCWLPLRVPSYLGKRVALAKIVLIVRKIPWNTTVPCSQIQPTSIL